MACPSGLPCDTSWALSTMCTNHLFHPLCSCFTQVSYFVQYSSFSISWTRLKFKSELFNTWLFSNFSVFPAIIRLEALFSIVLLIFFGISVLLGLSEFSEFSGHTGFSDHSEFSEFSGFSGFSEFSEFSEFSVLSWFPALSGPFEFSGISEFSESSRLSDSQSFSSCSQSSRPILLAWASFSETTFLCLSFRS
ncbi:unnamed protein product [Blepharisma stoltei]|uniref:Uncharacterized protein n=1 Tax=Blepharisma stoltei TaxID=1481888 RepID=A0AAU9JWI1_9CILI|nr:unnamed protein product [Blepharisma stoltei]